MTSSAIIAARPTPVNAASTANTAARLGPLTTNTALYLSICLVVGVCAVYAMSYFLSGRHSGTSRFRSFSRVYALVAIGGLGLIAAFGGLDEKLVGSLYTLLGTVAGFLAGARVPEGSPEAKVTGQGKMSDAVADSQTSTNHSATLSAADLSQVLGALRYSDI